MINIDRAFTFLLTTQSLDGGWGYAPEQASSVEATGAAILALRDDPNTVDAYNRGLAWLAAAQHDDGGWGINPDDEQSGWQTAWALLAQAGAGQGTSKGAQWLISVETAEPTADAMQRLSGILDIDLTLRGWPWLPNEATWIEPTALAMLALAAVGHSDVARVAEAVRYLTDRRCQGGGWNVGNPTMFSQPLPPRAHPTAWALMALARIALDAVLAPDVSALAAAVVEDGGALALAWGILAMNTLGLQDEALVTQLAALQREDGSWNANPYHTAVALLASTDKGFG